MLKDIYHVSVCGFQRSCEGSDMPQVTFTMMVCHAIASKVDSISEDWPHALHGEQFHECHLQDLKGLFKAHGYMIIAL